MRVTARTLYKPYKGESFLIGTKEREHELSRTCCPPLAKKKRRLRGRGAAALLLSEPRIVWGATEVVAKPFAGESNKWPRVVSICYNDSPTEPSGL